MNNFVIFLKKLIHHPLFYLLTIYFFIHLINLTLLPIFNDESIYLDWAWSFTHMPGHLFDSLLDAKQPLMIWVFAFFENIFTNPLFAGRLVSVIIGSITAIGIYVTTQKILNKRVAVVATLLYSMVPMFVFYNRQALMEAAIACIGIWSFNALLNIINNPTTKNGAILGIILGLGFLIKTSGLLFVVVTTAIIIFYVLKKKKTEIIKPYMVSIGLFLCINTILFVNPVFWQTLSTNSRFSYTLVELLAFPISSWISHLLGFFEIGFIFLTPLVFLCSLIGIFLIYKDKVKNSKTFLSYFFLALLLEIFLGKSQSQRYLVSFLPFLVIPASYIFDTLWSKGVLKKLIVIISFLISLILSLVLIYNPEYYIMQSSKISNYSDVPHVRGQTSGYGINETMQYIKEHSTPNQPTLVFFALTAGNPKNAINLYSSKDPQLFALHIDSKFFSGIENYECLTSQYQAFFITRNNELAGMDKYFTLEKSFPNPDGKYSVGIYTLKKDCKGMSTSLSYFYQDAMMKIMQIRN